MKRTDPEFVIAMEELAWARGSTIDPWQAVPEF